MKLEVGQFVRTKDGIIDKVIIDYNGHCASPNCECKHISCAKNYYDEDKIVKASYNIIDILEAGDFVSTIIGECAVIAGVYNDINIKKYLRLCNCIGEYYEDDIKKVITHEQMEQMAYKVEE